jgi:hypothetical protein
MPDEPTPNRDTIDLAPSARAKCRACRRGIEKGGARFAEVAPNPVAEGETRYYYHPLCAADKRPERMLAFLEAHAEVEDRERLRAAAELGVAHPRLSRLGAVGRSPSGRAACRHCRQNIDKGALRVALQPMEDGRLGAWGFVHADCARGYAGVAPSLERLQRYSEGLTDADWAEVATALTREVPAAERDATDAPEGGQAAPAEAAQGRDE